eukprot:4258978-Pyramimonas_sp.AAC.1
MQGTQMDLGKRWQSGAFEVHSLARSGRGQRDGCLTAINLKFFQKSEVRCEHAWMEGETAGISAQEPAQQEVRAGHIRAEWLRAHE